MNVIISKDFTFEASHVLPKHEGKCSRLHGHSWQLTVAVEGPVDKETGFVVDYAKLKKLVNTWIIDNIDHTHLGCGEAFTRQDTEFRVNRIVVETKSFFGLTFYPSSENLVIAIGRILLPLIPELSHDVRLYEVSLNETCTSKATWRPAHEG